MNLQRSVYIVEGMCCAEEQRVIEKRLRAVEGIEAFSFNLVAKKIYVTHSLSDAEVQSAITSAGFSSCPVDRAPDASRAPEGWGGVRLRTHIPTILSLLMTVLGIVLDAAAGADPLLTNTILGAAIVIGGRTTAMKAWAGLKTVTFDMNVLMSAAVLGALALGRWEEGAAVIALYALSQLLEELSMARTRRAISTLLESAPPTAAVIREGTEYIVSLEELAPGDTVKIRPGEKIPADGRVSAGRSSVNESAITGEPIPAEKIQGSRVYAGTLNERGMLEVEVERTGTDTTMAHIIHLVETAQAERAPSQRFIDRFAAIYSPSIMALAALIAIVPPLAFAADWGLWFYRALVLLVIACPCALVISTPVTIISGLTAAARLGILIKGGRVLEESGSIRAIAFDKTGTLTYGRPEVTDIVSADGISESTLLRIAALGEQHSEHVLADAILRKASELHIAVDEDSARFEAFPGKGIVMTIDGKHYRVGSRAFVEASGVTLSSIDARLQALENEGKTVIVIGSDAEALGAIGVADVVRSESREAFASFHANGIMHTVLLSGDNQISAQTVAARIGVEEAIGGLLPEQKVDAVKRLRERYGHVAMVGDGINDAPALASASIGIAMGSGGSDAAMETADVVLMNADLRSLNALVALSRRTMRILKQNIAIALLAKAVFLLLGIAGVATLWMAVVADDGVTLLVVANSFRLLKQSSRRTNTLGL